MAIHMTTPPTLGLPSIPAELVHALLPSIAEDLIGELAGGTEDLQIVRKLAAGHATPSIQGLIRLRVAYETSALLTEAGMNPTDIQAWWMTNGALNGVGEESSPVGVMRYAPLKDAASKILKAARAASGSAAAPYTWGHTVLLTLDVDGVLLPFSEWHSEARIEDFQPLDFAEPPLVARRFYYDPAVIAAVNRWAGEGILINWLTSWGRLAPRLLAPQLGLPGLGMLAQGSTRERATGSPWKRLALFHFLADLPPRNPIRLVAIDDHDLRDAGKQLRGMRSEKLLDSLVIEPRSSGGLTTAQVAQVDDFIARGHEPAAEDSISPRTVYLPTAADVATTIEEARTAGILSEGELATKAGVTPELIARLEAGDMAGGDLAAVVRVLEALGLHAVALPSIASKIRLEDIDLDEHLKRFE